MKLSLILLLVVMLRSFPVGATPAVPVLKTRDITVFIELIAESDRVAKATDERQGLWVAKRLRESVFVEWDAPAGSPFLVEVTDSSGPTKTVETTSFRFTPESLQINRTYTIRIALKTAQPPVWSEPVKIICKLGGPAKGNATWSANFASDEAENFFYHLSWGQQLFHPLYQIEVSRQADFLDPAKRQTLTSDVARVRFETERGDWRFWRVRAISPSGDALSEWSQPFALKVLRPYNEILSSRELLRRKQNRLSLGTGLSYVTYRQTADALASDLTLRAFSLSGARLEYERDFTSRWSARVSYQQIEGQANAESGIRLTNGVFRWLILDLSLRFFGDSLQALWPEAVYGRWFLTSGFQAHTLPYLDKQGSDFLSVARNSKKAMLGAGYLLGPFVGGFFGVEMRTGVPTAGDSHFVAGRNSTLEGELLYFFRWNKNVLVGFSWYGHLDRSELKDRNLNDLQLTEETLFSKADLKLTYEF